jgi:hypothetical protein
LSRKHDRELEARLASLRSGGTNARRVTDLRELTGDEADKVDVVVLCNVLHEIDVSEWLKTFEQVGSLLRDSGYVILIEDQTPSVGELPHRKGFVILDVLETRRLFAGYEGVKPIDAVVPKGWEDRITAIELPRSALGSATGGTISRALHEVKRRAMAKLEELRGLDASDSETFQTGRLHALYAMLWVNAYLAQTTYPFEGE